MMLPLLRSSLVTTRVLGHRCFDWLSICLVLILVPCFAVLFSVPFRLQLKCATERV